MDCWTIHLDREVGYRHSYFIPLKRVKIIAKAKSAGQLSHATSGDYLNLDDYFKSRELLDQQGRIEILEEKGSIVKQFKTSNEKQNFCLIKYRIHSRNEKTLYCARDYGLSQLETIKDTA